MIILNGNIPFLPDKLCEAFKRRARQSSEFEQFSTLFVIHWTDNFQNHLIWLRESCVSGVVCIGSPICNVDNFGACKNIIKFFGGEYIDIKMFFTIHGILWTNLYKFVVCQCNAWIGVPCNHTCYPLIRKYSDPPGTNSTVTSLLFRPYIVRKKVNMPAAPRLNFPEPWNSWKDGIIVGQIWRAAAACRASFWGEISN